MTNPKKIPLSKTELEKIFYYKDGDLFWINSGRGRKLNKPAGSKNDRGYIQI